MLGLGNEFTLKRDAGFLVGRFVAPSPGVSEGELWDDVQGGGLGAAVVCGYSEENLLFVVGVLGRFNEDIPVSVVTSKRHCQMGGNTCVWVLT